MFSLIVQNSTQAFMPIPFETPPITIIDGLILGTVQGLTEFLPVSSSGHLVIAEHLLHIQKNDLLLEIVVHLATLLAVFVFFYKDILALNFRKCLLLIVGTVPAVAFALLFKDFIESSFNSIWQNAIQLIITGVLLFIAQWKINETEKHPEIEEQQTAFDAMSIKQSLVIGSWQAVSILPAISRSGATVTGGLLTGMRRQDAFTYSFLLSIPAILGASVLQLSDITAIQALSQQEVIAYSVGAISAFIFGLISLKWFKYVVQKAKLHYFGVYCIVLGILLLLFL